MVVDTQKEKIYIVISQTGTVLSRILRKITGAEYNHVSLSLDKDLQLLYSFGRKNPYYPFWGGFVTESPNFGTFKRFYNTDVIVLSVDVDEHKFRKIENTIELMLNDRRKYHYNYLGLYLAALKINHKGHNRFYCSEFVRDILQSCGVNGSAELPDIIQPIHFLNMPYCHEVYNGKLSYFAK